MKVFASANRLKILIYLSYFHIYKSIAKRYHHYAFCISALCIFVVRQHDKSEVKGPVGIPTGLHLIHSALGTQEQGADAIAQIFGFRGVGGAFPVDPVGRGLLSLLQGLQVAA